MIKFSLVPGLVIALVLMAVVALVSVCALARIAYALAATAGACP